MSYYCERRAVLPSFVHPTPLLIQYKHQEVQTPLDALPDHLLIRIFKNCRLECPCFFHSQVLNTSTYYLSYMYLKDNRIEDSFKPVRICMNSLILSVLWSLYVKDFILLLDLESYRSLNNLQRNYVPSWALTLFAKVNAGSKNLCCLT